jgi:hypothetical protein
MSPSLRFDMNVNETVPCRWPEATFTFTCGVHERPKSRIGK